MLTILLFFLFTKSDPPAPTAIIAIKNINIRLLPPVSGKFPLSLFPDSFPLGGFGLSLPGFSSPGFSPGFLSSSFLGFSSGLSSSLTSFTVTLTPKVVVSHWLSFTS